MKVNKRRAKSENKSKANPVLIECLDVLETSYLNLKSKKKIKNVKSDN